MQLRYTLTGSNDAKRQNTVAQTLVDQIAATPLIVPLILIAHRSAQMIQPLGGKAWEEAVKGVLADARKLKNSPEFLAKAAKE